ncbi:MAG: rhodanese-like domain-containing protein, partial [Tepidiforma sp.]
MGYARPELLAEPDWLQQHLDDPGVRIIDCAVLEAYRRAHIPGAVHLPVHYYIKEAGPPGADHGTFVMPPAEFEALMGRLGVSNDTLVVTYDDNNALVAARLWWVLTYYGHTNVKVLNGGWHRWLTEGRPITFHATRPKPASFTARPNPDLIADAEYLKARIGDPGCQILDARTDGEWDGTNDRGNRRVGRVPGAKHLEWVRFVE